MTPARTSGIYLVLSAFGILFIVLISWLGSRESSSITLIERVVVGGAFIASCLFGMSLALRPGWIRGSSRVRAHVYIERKEEGREWRMVGHHPDCGEFEGHTLKFAKRTLCSGCSGLALGSIGGIFLSLAYVAFGLHVEPVFLYVLVTTGLLLVVFEFLDITFSMGDSRLHGGLNILMVIGFFFVVVGIHQLTGNTAFGLIGIVISFLWLDTRIQLSGLRHRQVCGSCSQACKAY